jgi:hypothetical protein
MAFSLMFPLLNWLHVNWTGSWWLGFSLPDAASAFVTGTVTSLICGLIRLKDVASALYFAPLVFPAIILAVLFSVVWIPICVGGCLAVPMKAIFIYITTAVCIKLPINLVAGLATGAIVASPPYHTLRAIQCRKLVGSRRLFIALANALLFVIIWPELEYLSGSYGIGVDYEEWMMLLPSIPLWVLASICIGIASLGLADAIDWGLFAFISAAGSGIILWTILFINSLVMYDHHGTLQLSIHAAATAIVCIGLSLSAGSISVVSAVLWVVFTGVPAKGV